MESIQPDFLWQVFEENDALPEGQLILAIIVQAWKDANKRIACTTREDARQWFFSNQFEHYCDLLNIDSSAIQTKMVQYWK